MKPLNAFEQKIDAYIDVMKAAGFSDVVRGLELACAVAAPIIEELQAKKQRRPMNLSPEERQRRAERLLAYHAKRRENRA